MGVGVSVGAVSMVDPTVDVGLGGLSMCGGSMCGVSMCGLSMCGLSICVGAGGSTTG